MDQQELYAKHARASSGARPAEVAPRIRDLVRLITHEHHRIAKDGVRVLELGFGDGELTFELGRCLPNSRVLGIDIAQERVDTCLQRAVQLGLSERVSFQSLDLERNLDQLASDSADIIVAIDVMEHLFDVFAFVDQLARVVSAGGRLILRVPNAAYVKRRLELLSGRLPVTASWFGPSNDIAAWRSTWGWDGGHLHFFTLSTLRALVESAGFRVRAWTDPGVHLPRLRAVLPGLLYGNLCLIAERRP